MASLDATLEAVAALVTSTFGLLVLAGAPGRRTHRTLAAFLFLISANQVLEAFRAVAPAGPLGTALADAAALPAAFDPLALVLFARAYVGEAPGPRWVPWAALAASLGIAGVAGASLVAGRDLPRWLLPAYSTLLALAYTHVLLAFQRAYARRPADALRWLVPAGYLAALPTWSYAFLGWIGLALDPMPRVWGFDGALATTALALLVLALAAVALPAAQPPAEGARRLNATSAATALLVTTVLFAFDVDYALHQLGLAPDLPGLVHVGRAAAAVRWLLFSVLASVAVLRHQGMPIEPRIQRLAARVLVAIGLVGATFLLVALLDAGLASRGYHLSVVEVVLLVAVIGLSQGFRAGIDAVAHRVYGIAPRAAASAHVLYKDAVRLAILEGRDVDADEGLTRLREELGVGGRTALTLRALAEEESDRPIVLGRTLAGRYEVERALSTGASRVYVAKDRALHRRVVLKEVPREGPADDAGVKEARIAGAIRHPHVVTLYDVLQRPRSAILVCEHAEGGSLEERVRRDGPLPLAEGLRILDEVLDGLAAVHALGVVHRDLKPANVVLDGAGRAKITDFGIARLRAGATVALGEAPSFAGTPAFMSPEQRRGERATSASDVYAAARLARAILPPDLPPGVEAILRQAEAEDPATRPSAEAMRAALR